MYRFEERVVMVRKRRQCFWCHEWIEVGNHASVSSVADGGSVRSNYYHPECYTAESLTRDYVDTRHGDWDRSEYHGARGLPSCGL